MDSNALTIRLMEDSDLEAVVRVEEESFPLPFSGSLFLKFMDQDAFHCWVIVSGKEVVGYLVYSVEADEADILNIAVDEKWRRKGVGSLLIKHMMEHASGLGGQHIFLEVRASNEVAKAFYKKWEFFQVGVRHGYYHDTGEDALVFSREI